MSTHAAWIRFATALTIGFVAASDVSAQIVKLTRIAGGVEVGTDISHQETESGTGPTRTFDRYRFDEEVELSADGYVLTSQLLNFHLGGSFGLRQELLEGPSSSGKSNTTLIGYDGVLSLFPTKLFSLLLFANRHQDETVQNFGTDNQSLGESMGATLGFNNWWFPSALSVEQRHTRSESDGGLFENKRDETRQLIEFHGNHSSEALQARLGFKTEDIDDASVPPVGDYRVYDADATLSYRWGPYFEKFFRWSGGYFERQGNFNFRNASESASFYWGLTDSLNASIEQSFDLSESDGQNSNSVMSVFTLRHQLWDSLSTNFNASYETSRQDIGVRNTYGTNLTLNYEKEIPWNSRVMIDLSGSFRFEDRAFDEVQTVSTSENLATRGLTENFLRNSNVSRDSIQVFEIADGRPLEPPLTEGFDYAIEVSGDLTSIDILTTGSIREGDTVFVDYVYLSDPSGQVMRPGFRVGVAWDAGWIALRYEHDEDKETLVQGEDQPLQAARRDVVRVDLRKEWGALEAGASAQFLRDASGSTEYDEIAFGQELTWQPRRNIHLTLVLRESQRYFRRPVRDVRTVTAGVSAAWQIAATSNVRVFGDFRDLHNSDSLDQRDASLGARANLRFGKIEVLPSLVWTRRQRGESISSDLRSSLRLRRRF